MSHDREREAPRPPEAFRTLLQLENRTFGLSLRERTVSGLATYLAELDSWRQRVNLTGRLSARDLATHALESVVGAELIVHGARVVDIGSGAGFPGLPLAIAREDLAVALVEPRAKRAAFLRHVVRALALGNVEVIESRIEDLENRTFDVATTRAVGNFADWLRGTPFLRPSGRLLAWTTDTVELASALGTGFILEEDLPIPGTVKRRITAFRPAA
jgi:16S rRNA (guanine527-N7)-methyltransferase